MRNGSLGKKTVRDIDVKGKRVLVRVDYNVPLDKDTGAISDDIRIRASVPTIRYLLDEGASVILCSHFGRPKGEVVEDMRLKPIVQPLSRHLGLGVTYLMDCIGAEVAQAVDSLRPGQVILLENVRFHAGEEKNDPAFARELASLADVYVNDAFSAAHRAHASTEGVAHVLPSVVGLALEKELEMLGGALGSPARPLAAVIGGAKVSDKIAVLEHLADQVEVLAVGGGMVATLLKAGGANVGGSPVEEDYLEVSRRLIARSQSGSLKLLLPTDVVAAESFAKDADFRAVPVDQIPDGWLILDIGPESAEAYASELAGCRTVVWNGPMGVFEWEAFAWGTRRVAQALADLQGKATTIVGGGSTAEAVQAFGVDRALSHVSLGGGASLEFLEGKVLPGLAALPDK
ncbi:MAG: phosphoglycerate kinase [Chloroflexi bacterium]|jgi:phosphoglycerate kinase|nr:MAG: phosphoglycerate kinase [Chloroflexota bacterium]